MMPLVMQSRDTRGPAPPLIVIGASAGGPSAVATVLRDLPAQFGGAIVIIQHVDARFADHMATWLSDQSPTRVRIAREGDRLAAGQILLAGTDDHLVLTRTQTLAYIAEPRDAFYRPSIDVFMKSVCQYWQGMAVGVLLTGMGTDGASGLRALRNNGAVTIAQDRASSVVYGMPKAAAELDAASEVLPVTMIGSRLTALCHGTLSPGGGSSHV